MLAMGIKNLESGTGEFLTHSHKVIFLCNFNNNKGFYSYKHIKPNIIKQIQPLKISDFFLKNIPHKYFKSFCTIYSGVSQRIFMAKHKKMLIMVK